MIVDDLLNDSQQNQSMLEILHDDDSLRMALLWTPASDHANLYSTCSRIRNILKSCEYVKDRCEYEFAQVSVTVTNQEEVDREREYDYDENFGEYDDYGCYIGDYGDVSFSGLIFVDNVKAGSFSVDLLPTTHTAGFHEIADSVSGELQYISCLFFTDRGDPTRVKSVKDAHEVYVNKTCSSGEYFVYVKKLELYAPYRDHTFVGSSAVRKIFNEDILDHRWSLAMYIPATDNYFRRDACNTDDQRKLFKEKIVLDMKHFLRAGFKQVEETVSEATCYFVFCTPSFLQGPTLTDVETNQIEVVKQKPEREVPDHAKALLHDIVGACPAFKEMQRGVKECRDTISETNAMIHSMIEQHGRDIASLNGSEAMLSAVPDHTRAKVAGEIRKIRQEIEERRASTESKFESMRSRAQQIAEETEGHLCAIKNEFKSKVQKHVKEHGHGVIIEANALHACAANLVHEYVDELLKQLPVEERKQALNSLDCLGNTPLMIAAGQDDSRGDDRRGKRFHFCQYLLNLGADADKLDEKGKSALGHYRQSYRDGLDVMRAFSLISRSDVDQIVAVNREMESLLRPSMGPSAADDELIDDGNSLDRGVNDEDDGDDFDDDDESDDEDDGDDFDDDDNDGDVNVADE